MASLSNPKLRWISRHHPDPHFEQMRVFQEAVVHMKTGLKNIPLDVFTDTQRPFEKGPSTAEMFSKPIFVWYDFFSCPQADTEVRFSTFCLQDVCLQLPMIQATRSCRESFACQSQSPWVQGCLSAGQGN